MIFVGWGLVKLSDGCYVIYSVLLVVGGCGIVWRKIMWLVVFWLFGLGCFLWNLDLVDNRSCVGVWEIGGGIWKCFKGLL